MKNTYNTEKIIDNFQVMGINNAIKMFDIFDKVADSFYLRYIMQSYYQ